MNGGWGISYEIALRWMPLDLTDDKSTLVQVMAWCRQATSHYLNQCWPRSMSPNGATMPQWVNVLNTPHVRKMEGVLLLRGSNKRCQKPSVCPWPLSPPSTEGAGQGQAGGELAFVPNADDIMKSWNGNIFRVIGHVWGEFTVYRWIPLTKASDGASLCEGDG